VDFTLDLDTSISAHDASVVLDSYVEKMMELPFAQLAEAGKESALWAATATAEEVRLEAQEEQEYQAALAASCDFSPYASSFSPPLSSQLANITHSPSLSASMGTATTHSYHCYPCFTPSHDYNTDEPSMDVRI
jgi:hypothetical protein